MKKIFTIAIILCSITLNAQIFIKSTDNGVNTSTVTNEVNEAVETYSTTTSTTTTSAKESIAYKSTSVLDDVPPNAEAGKCYARCLVPTTYKYVTSQVIDQPQMVKKVKLPALYMMVYDTIITKPKTTKTYQVPAEYEYVEEQIMATPATTKWIKGKADAGCLSANPEDCQVMCLVEVPATYRTVKRKVMKSAAFTKTQTVPMDYKITTKQVQIKEESYQEIVIPASYKTVSQRVVDQQGGYQVWREILCGNDLTEAKIIQIQRALKAAGYNPGPMDNIFGAETKAALIAYQKANGLPVGNLNFETLSALGVN